MKDRDERAGEVEAEGGSEAFDFERALGRIEAIVRTLEEGRGGLDESLSLYEEGVKLLRRCHSLLRTAEQRIELLAGWDEAGEAITEPFDARETFASSSSSASPASAAFPLSPPPSALAKDESTSASSERAEPSHRAGSRSREDVPAGQTDAAPAQSARQRGGRRSERP